MCNDGGQKGTKAVVGTGDKKGKEHPNEVIQSWITADQLVALWQRCPLILRTLKITVLKVILNVTLPVNFINAEKNRWPGMVFSLRWVAHVCFCLCVVAN